MNDRDKAYFKARVSREMDADLKPLVGRRPKNARAAKASKRPNPGVRFHVWICRNRPDVRGTSAYWARRTG